MTRPNQPTDQQRRLATLAAALASANPDAAEALGRLLVAEAERAKQPQGFAIELRWNGVTERLEVRGPQSIK